MRAVWAPEREGNPTPDREGGALTLSATRPPGSTGRSGRLGAGPARPARPYRLTAAVLALGFVITAALVWTSWSLNSRNEGRLLTLQTDQAGDVLAAAVPSVEAPLTTSLEVASASNGDVREFTGYISAYIGPGKEFVSVSLWRLNGTTYRRVVTVGAADFAPSVQVRASLARAGLTPGLIVSAQQRGANERIGYALAPSGRPSHFEVYAEHAVPADRKAAVSANSAFADLHYAIYIGRSERPSDLLATSFSHLPPTGRTAKVTVPFGNTVLTLVGAPTEPLEGTWPSLLPWIFGASGVFLSAAAAWTTARLVRQRRSAERDATEIKDLYGELGTLFAQQRTIAETLQRVLLPQSTPDIAGMEFAVQYVPGAKGMEIGGDWYSVISVDEEHFAFVVGDVSGRGLSAATVMAELRFTIRAYIREGYSPSVILEKCSGQLQFADGHFATVLVGLVDVRAHQVTLANAGHLNPLLIDGHDTKFIFTPVGVPLGVPGGPYETITFSVPAGSTMIAFTDGLVERRGESLDVGLARLENAARGKTGPLDDLVSQVIVNLTEGASEDDIAVLGLRWQD